MRREAFALRTKFDGHLRRESPLRFDRGDRRGQPNATKKRNLKLFFKNIGPFPTSFSIFFVFSIQFLTENNIADGWNRTTKLCTTTTAPQPLHHNNCPKTQFQTFVSVKAFVNQKYEINFLFLSIVYETHCNQICQNFTTLVKLLKSLANYTTFWALFMRVWKFWLLQKANFE